MVSIKRITLLPRDEFDNRVDSIERRIKLWRGGLDKREQDQIKREVQLWRESGDSIKSEGVNLIEKILTRKRWIQLIEKNSISERRTQYGKDRFDKERVD